MWILAVGCVGSSAVLVLLDDRTRHGPIGNAGQLFTSVLLASIILTIATFGALILFRQPGNSIGWLFGTTALVIAVAFPLSAYADIGTRPVHDLPGAHLAAWYDSVAQGPVLFVPIVLLILLFPTGRPLSPRWRPVINLALADACALLLITSVTPGPLSNFSSVENPLGLPLPIGVLNAALTISYVVLLALIAAGAVSFVLRFRRSRGEERLQLKWFLSAIILLAIVILASPILWTLPGPVWTVALITAIVAVLLAVGISMLKYRLYEIDLIINRALVYGSLTITLAALYLAVVIGIQALFRAVTGQGSDLAVAISTLLIAALFNPWRHRLQRFIDRRFYRQKYDAVRALSSFQSRLRDNVDLEDLSTDLAMVVSQTVQPSSIALWLAPEKPA